MGLGYPTTYVYQLFFDENYSNDTKIVQYFIIHGLGLCIKFDSFVAHILYSWSFSNNLAAPIAIKKNTYFILLNKYTTVFS